MGKPAGRAVLAVFIVALLASTPARAQAQVPPAYDAPPPGAPAPFALAPPPRPGGVFVELRGSSPKVRLERMVGQLRVPVCYAPCRLVLPTSELYVIGGDGVRSTSVFSLPTDRPQVTLDVDAGSSSALAGGAVLMLVGIVVGYVGYAVFIAGGLADTLNADNGTTTHDAAAGVFIGLGGLALAGVGLIIALNAHTTVRSSTGSVFTDAPPRPRRRPAIALTPRGLEF